ncbi:MAG: glycosyltransferase family 2 protein [Candidatus Omnitrophica bacterium]|nr:glycosyltransferase family 2 protein [Candidatus Omnitrophota bacterium]
MKKITALIAAYNEEDRIRACLESVQWADEILLVDSFSTDRTAEIAREYGARILQREFDTFSSQINWAIPRASHEWILRIDADERVTEALKRSIQDVLNADSTEAAYSIKRKNLFLGCALKHGHWGDDWIARLFQRDRGRMEECGYHGDLLLDRKPPKIQGELIHLTYRSVDDYFHKFHQYTQEGAERLYQQEKPCAFTHLFFRPLWRFIHSYFIRLGFLDGIPGLIVCVLSSFYVFTKYFILWHLYLTQAPKTGPV